MKLWKREIAHDSRAVLARMAHLLTSHHVTPSGTRAARNITRVLRAGRLPALIRNGGKP